jgi:hypothetical protein
VHGTIVDPRVHRFDGSSIYGALFYGLSCSMFAKQGQLAVCEYNGLLLSPLLPTINRL